MAEVYRLQPVRAALQRYVNISHDTLVIPLIATAYRSDVIISE